jgi:hypothetical protein
MFTTRKGAPLGHVYYGHNLIGRAVTQAGLPKGTTSHDLRHHYTSVLRAAGESVVAVAERLGREDASLVLSTYGHLMPDSDDRTRTAIDAAWDAASASCAPDVPQGRRVGPLVGQLDDDRGMVTGALALALLAIYQGFRHPAGQRG